MDIAQTGRTLNHRVKEHKRAVKLMILFYLLLLNKDTQQELHHEDHSKNYTMRTTARTTP